MTTSEGHPRTQGLIGLGDTVSIIVGIIVGVGIFQTPALVFRNVSGPWEALGLWVVGGVLSLTGALCFAELASTYPRSGGEYVYLTRAYGPAVGFLSAWAQLAVIRTGGGIAALAYVFAGYTGLGPVATVALAVAAIAVLTGINILGVNPGKQTQNALTLAKVVGLAAIVAVGFLWGRPAPAATTIAVAGAGSLALSMLFVLYAYEGWSEAAYVAAEVRDARRNLPLALVLGTALVMGIYLAVNAACLVALGFDAARSSPAVVADVLALALGEWGGRAMSLLVMVSALGAIQGTIFTGSRLYSTLGADHRLFAVVGRWHPRLGTPVCSLLLQAAISAGMVVLVGAIWRAGGGFETLVKCTAPVFWLFFLLTGLSLFVLRWRDGGSERPFRVPLYPLVPLVFCGWCAYMLYGSIAYARGEAAVGLGILLAGIPFYAVSQRLGRSAARGQVPVGSAEDPSTRSAA